MPRINHWWTTRPKRRLITIVDVLRVFLTVAEGKVWKGDKKLHLEFEKALEDAGLKGKGKRRDQGGGGGRTYAAWLFSFGLWFAEDATGIVRATLAGDDVLKGHDPVPILGTQILNFQYPSPYSRTTKVDLRFKIFPFRFILRLLLDARLNGYLTEKELAAIVVPCAETDGDLGSVIGELLRHRSGRSIDSVFDAAFEAKYGKAEKVKDTANTFVNQLEFTQLIDRIGNNKFRIASGKVGQVEKLLRAASDWISRNDEYEFFQRKYGTGPNHKRDNRTFRIGSSISPYDAERSKVLVILWSILANEPIKTIDKTLINRISLKSGIKESSVERIIAAVGVTPSYELFERNYLELSMGGTATARDFEKSTQGVFGPGGLGFDTEWIGSSPNNPDVLAFSLDTSDEFLGIIDAKAYKAYTISGDHRRNMSHNYVPKFKKYNYKGKDYVLAFFSYVAGGLGATIDNGINRIFTDTGICGAAVTAQELLALLRQHRLKPFSKTELKTLFALNRRILPTDFIP